MISGWLIGDAELVAKLTRTAPAIQNALEGSVRRLALMLLRHVKEDKLSDQVLRVRTGRLRRSITQAVQVIGPKVTGIVGTNVAYAARQEYGFKGQENVRSHLRTIKKAWGRPIAERSVMVRPFTRNVNYPAHSFLRSALADMRQQINADMDKALNQAVRTGS